MTQSSTESCPNNPDLTAAETTRHGVCYRSLTFFFSFFLSKKLSCGGLSLQPQQVLQHHWAQQETSADACRGSWEKSDFRIKGDESNSSWKRATLEQRGGLLPELLPSSTQQGRTAAALPRQSTNPSNHCRPFITPRLLTSSAQIKGAKSHRSLQAIPAAYSKQELRGPREVRLPAPSADQLRALNGAGRTRQAEHPRVLPSLCPFSRMRPAAVGAAASAESAAARGAKLSAGKWYLGVFSFSALGKITVLCRCIGEKKRKKVFSFCLHWSAASCMERVRMSSIICCQMCSRCCLHEHLTKKALAEKKCLNLKGFIMSWFAQFFAMPVAWTLKANK